MPRLSAILPYILSLNVQLLMLTNTILALQGTARADELQRIARMAWMVGHFALYYVRRSGAVSGISIVQGKQRKADNQGDDGQTRHGFLPPGWFV